MFKCSDCDVSFTRKDNLKRHDKYSCRKRLLSDKFPLDDEPKLKVIKSKIKSSNSSSQTKNSSIHNYASHIPNKMMKCASCNIDVITTFYNSHLKSQLHKEAVLERKEQGIEIIKSAFKCRINTYRFTGKTEHVDFNDFFNEIGDKFYKIVNEERIKHNMVKINVELYGIYMLPSEDTYEIKSFNTKNEICSISCDVMEMYENLKSTLITKAQEFQERDSGKFLMFLIIIIIIHFFFNFKVGLLLKSFIWS